MPYDSINELPTTFKGLPAEAKKQALEVVNSCLGRGDPEETAIRKAWGAVKKSWTKQGEDWVKKMEELETEDLDGIELFAVGTWNGDSYTEEDLDAMVEAAEAGVPPTRAVKLGHIKDGKPVPLTADFASPAVGWVENLRRQGDKLFGDLKAVPKTLAKLIRAGAYRHRSSEVYWNYTDKDGKVWPRVFKALALLGDKPPAVQNLADIAALYSYEEEPGDIRVYEQEEDELEVALGAIGRFFARLRANATYGRPSDQMHDDYAAKEGFPASDWAYVPDPEKPSTWKLRLTKIPGGDPDPGIVGAACAALGPGFRGEKVDIPDADLPGVIAKVKIAWKKANPDKNEEDMPEVLGAKSKKQEDDEVSDNLKAVIYEVLGLPEDASEETAETQLRAMAKEPDAVKYLDRDSEEYKGLKEKADRTDKAEAEAAEAAKAQYESEREAVLSKAQEDGKITPDEVGDWRKRYDEKKDWTVDVLEALPAKVEFGERGAGSTTVEKEEGDLIKAVHEHMKSNSELSYEDAYDIVKVKFGIKE